MSRPKRWHVCSHVGCAELVSKNEPCPTHSRPKSNWGGRDIAAHNRWAKRVKARDGHRCTRCGSRLELHAHHLRPGNDIDAGITLCRTCHRQVDKQAR
jgi:hypothetical protein